MKRKRAVVVLLLAVPIIAAASWATHALLQRAGVLIGVEFVEAKPSAPLSKLRFTRLRGQVDEAFFTLQPGVALESVVDLGLFKGFDPRMTAELAASRLGHPSGEWVDPYYKISAPYYQRPQGRVSLCRVPASGAYVWTVVGYPHDAALARFILDPRVLQQVASTLPVSEQSQANILRSVGWGGVSLIVRDGKVRTAILTGRDDEQPISHNVPANNSFQGTRHAHVWLAALGAIVLARP